MKKVKEFKTPLYGVPFVVCSSREAAAEYLGEDHFIEGASACAGSFDIDGISHVLMIFDSPNDHCVSVIAHESLHAAWDILHVVGVEVSHDNQEPLAYLVGWCAKVANNFMIKHCEAK